MTTPSTPGPSGTSGMPGMPTPVGSPIVTGVFAPVATSSPIRRTSPLRQANAVLYQQFLEAMNMGDQERIGQLMTPTFVDHHPGFEINGLACFQEAVREVRAALRFQGDAEDILQIDDQVITRVRWRGTHVGTILGIPSTGRQVEWTSIEIWRVSNGKFAERWAQEDLLGLRDQLAGNTENLALVRRVADALNARDHDTLDELLAPSFVDHNPVCDARSLDEFKSVVGASVEAFDFTTDLDQLYAADGSRVVAHVTCTGRHVGSAFGRLPTGRDIEWTSTEVYRIADGKIAERWVQADVAALMRQVGVPLPPA